MMTEDMVEAARNNKWDRVTAMEESRRNALAECFHSPIPEDYTELFSEALAAMLHLNEELIAVNWLLLIRFASSIASGSLSNAVRVPLAVISPKIFREWQPLPYVQSM